MLESGGIPSLPFKMFVRSIFEMGKILGQRNKISLNIYKISQMMCEEVSGCGEL